MKNKRMMTVMILALIVIFAGGVTLAYFTDKSDEVKNTFVMGNVDIILDEAELKEETDETGTLWTALTNRVTENTYNNLYPGAILPKDPTVKNIGTNPAYIRVKVTLTEYADFALLLEDPATLWNTPLGTGWVLDSSDEGVYTYNYTDVVSVGEVVPPVFTKVTIPKAFDNAAMASIDGFTISVVAEAIQAQGFGNVTEAFAAFVPE